MGGQFPISSSGLPQIAVLASFPADSIACSSVNWTNAALWFWWNRLLVTFEIRGCVPFSIVKLLVG
jgi:hypothetical protein